MATTRLRPMWQAAFALAVVPLLMALAAPAMRADDDRVKTSTKAEMTLPAVFTKAVPETVDDLKQIQSHVKTVIDKVMPAVVNIKAGMGQGSGVIISEDGYVLTAGHVSQKPNKDCLITFPDGKSVKGKTLGWNKFIDSGLIKIVKEGKYPYCEMGKSAELHKGEWCMAIGHPGGFKEGRTPPVRVGRVLDAGPMLVISDCTLVGGDSGGPLFDMHGKVIGIHSRIDFSIKKNLHVPVDTYRETWDQLAEGLFWETKTVPGTAAARLGLQADPKASDCKILKLDDGSPAEKAGLKINDIITQIDGKKITTFEDLQTEIGRRKPGDTVRLVVRRGDETLNVEAVLGKASKN
jgi:serine protease Do